ncbi:MAG: hypothetical protein FWD47_01700 [Treponema sp.]|nr:hypothetical protein [Treponema sp.]
MAWGDEFEWKGGSSWTVASNWRNITTGEENASRFPNGAGDTALINVASWPLNVYEPITLDSLYINVHFQLFLNNNSITVNRLFLNTPVLVSDGLLASTTTELNNDFYSNNTPNAELSSVNLIINDSVTQIDSGNNFTMDGAPIQFWSTNLTITKSNPGQDLRVGRIIAGNRNITLTSARDITFTGDVYSNRLIINASSGNVTVNGSANINTIGVANSPLGECNTPPNIHTGNVSIYINTNQFRAYGGTGVIIPAASGQVCFNVAEYLISPNKINGNRYHFHGTPTPIVVEPIIGHLVYGTFVPSDIPLNHTYIDSSRIDLDTLLSYSVDLNYNIYIVDVGDSNPANTRSIDFIINGTGFIEIRGGYTTTGFLNLSPGDGGIRLVDANINLIGNSFDAAYPIILDGTSSINAMSILLGDVTSLGANDLTLNSVAGIITVGSITGVRDLSLTGLLFNIYNNITTTRNQNYNGAINLGTTGTRILTSTNGSIVTTNTVNGNVGLTVNANNGITIGLGGVNIGTSNVLTLNSSAGNININGNITNTNRLVLTAPNNTVTVAAPVTINVSSTGNHFLTPGDGNGINSAIFVNANTFNAVSGSGIIYPGPGPTRANGEICLNVINFTGNGNGRIDGNRYHFPCDSGGIINDLEDIHIVYTTLSTSAIPGDIPADHIVISPSDPRKSFTASANYNIYIIDVASTDDLIFTTSGDGFIEFRGTNILSGAVTLATALTEYVEFNGTNTISGIVLNITTGNINLNGTLNRGSNAFNTSTPSIPLTLIGTSNTITTAANINLGTVTGVGNFILNGTAITLDGIVNINGAMTVNNSGLFTQNAAITANGGINFTGTVTLNGVTLSTVDNDISFGGIVTLGGTGTSILNSGTGNGNISFTSTANPAITGTGNLTLTAGTGNVGFSGQVGTNAATRVGNVIVNSTNNVTFGQSVFAESVEVNNNSASTINANINTSGNQTYTGAVTLGGAGTRTFTSSAGNVTFAGVVTGSDITVNAATGISMDAAPGNVINSINLNNNGTTGDINYNGNRGSANTLSVNINNTANAIDTGNIIINETGNVAVAAGNSITVNSGNTGVAGLGGSYLSEPCTTPSTIYINANNFSSADNNSINPGAGELCLDLTVQRYAADFTSLVSGNFHLHNEIVDRHIVFYSASQKTIAQLLDDHSDFASNPDIYRFVNVDLSVPTADNFNPALPISNYQTPDNMNLYFVDVGHTALALPILASNTAFVEFRGYNSFQVWFAAFETNGGGIRFYDTDFRVPTQGTNSLLNKVTFVGNNIDGSVTNVRITALAVQLGIDHFPLPSPPAIQLGSGSINVEGNNIDLTITATGGHWDIPAMDAINSSVTIFKTIPAGIRNLTINSTGRNPNLASTDHSYNINILGNLDVETVTINTLTNTEIANTLTNTGNIRQPNTGTGAIKAETVTINATGAITLDNPGNNIDTINITRPVGTGNGAIQFTNNKALEIEEINIQSGADRNVTINAVGAITQTGAIETTGTFTANVLATATSGGITLDNAANNVATVNLTNNTSGDIEFNNNTAALTATATNNATTGGNISITNTGNLTVGAGAQAIRTAVSGADINLTSTNGVITVTGGIGTALEQNSKVNLTAGTNIAIAGTINCYQLVIKAGNKTGNVNLTGLINVSSPGEEDLGGIICDEDSAIYIEANDFTVTAGGSVNNIGFGDLCLDLVIEYVHDAFDSVVTGNYHLHNPNDRHIVLSFTEPSASFHPDLNTPNYRWVNANEAFTNQAAPVNRHIYIIDVPINAWSSAANLTFTTTGQGYVEFRGTNNFTGDGLTINTDVSIRFNNGTLNRGSNQFWHSSTIPVTLVGTTNNTINATQIALPVITGTGNIELNASDPSPINIFINTSVGAAGSPIGNITVNGNIFFDDAEVFAVNYSQNTGTGTARDNQTYSGTFYIASGASFDIGIYDLSAVNFNIAGTLTAEAASMITVEGGTWTRTGTFNHGDGAVIFNSATVNGSNTFHNVICNGTVLFQNSFTQTINTLTLDGSVIRGVITEDPENYWTINIQPGNINLLNMPTIKDCYSTNELNLNLTSIVANDGGNNERVFIKLLVDRHIIYTTHVTNPDPSITPYVIINPTDPREIFSASAGYNIYIIDVDPSTDKNLTFITNSVDFIEFRGINSFTSTTNTTTLTTERVRLNDTIVDFGNNHFNANLLELLGVDNNITAGYITIGGITGSVYNNLALVARNHNLEESIIISGNVSNAAIDKLSLLHVVPANRGAIRLNGNIVVRDELILGDNANQVGAISQTGSINAANLLINSTGVNNTVTLTNPGNNIETLSITGAGATVQFTNSDEIEIIEISDVGANNVTIIASGAITQSGSIEINGTLILNSSDIITLNETGNSIRTLNITGAGGTVDFTNTGALTIAGINNVGSNDITIENTGIVNQNGAIVTTGILSVTATGGITLDRTDNNTANITFENNGSGNIIYVNSGSLIVGDVTNSNGEITLRSADNQNININGAVTGTIIILEAGAKNGDVIINTTGTLTSTGTGRTNLGGSSLNVACDISSTIYIGAKDFSISSANINPSGATHLCLDLDTVYTDHYFHGFVAGDRYHLHNVFNGNRDVVYYDGTIYTTTQIEDIYSALINPYFIDSNISNETTIFVNTNNSIFIHEVGDVPRSMTFEIRGTAITGQIHVIGDYEASELTLLPGSEGVFLNNANIELDGATSTFNVNQITLNGSDAVLGSTIEANSITIGTIIGVNNSLTLTSSAVTADAIDLTIADNLRNLIVDGNSTIRGSIETVGTIQSTTDAQVYNGAVTLGATVNLSAAAGSNIHFQNTVNGANALVVNSGNVIFDNIVGGNTRLTSININNGATGTTTINNNINTTGDQIYGANTGSGLISLIGNINFSTTSNAIVRFNGNVDSNGSLTVADAVPNTTTTIITGNIGTAGNQTYNGHVRIGGTVNLTANTGSTITLNRAGSTDTVESIDVTARALTITNANAVFNGNVGTVVGTGNPIASVNVTGGGSSDINADITTTTTQNYGGDVEFGGGLAGDTRILTTTNSTVTLGANLSNNITGNDRILLIDSNAVFNGVSDGIRTLTVNGTSGINGNITTSGAQTYNGNVTLGEDIILDATTAGNLISFHGNINNNYSLTVINANAMFGLAAGGNTVNVGSVSVSGESQINADITTTGTQTYTGNVLLGGAGTTRTLEGVTVTMGAITGNNLSLLVTGNAVFNGSTNTGMTTLEVTGTSEINGNITTSGNQTYTGNVTLGASVILNVTTAVPASWVYFNDEIEGDYLLTINSTNARFNGDVDIGSMVVNGISNVNANITTATTQDYNGDITLGGTTGTTRELTGTIINIGNIVGQAAYNLELNGTGSINISGDTENIGDLSFESPLITVGGKVGTDLIDRIGNITVTSNGTVAFNDEIYAVSFTQTGTGSTTFVGIQNYSGNYSFTGNVLTVEEVITVSGETNMNNTGAFTLIKNAYFEGDYITGASGELTGANPVEIYFGADVVLGNFTHHNDSEIIFYSVSGTTAAHDLSFFTPPSSNRELCNVLIKMGSTVTVINNNTVTQRNTRTLKMEAGSGSIDGARLILIDGSWQIGNGTGQAGFTGYNGNLLLGGTPVRADRETLGSRITATNLNLNNPTSFTLENSFWATLEVTVNANISAAPNLTLAGNTPQLVLYMNGIGAQTLTVNQPIGSFHVGENSQTTLASVGTVSFRGEVFILSTNASNSWLNAANNNIIMYAGLEGTRNLIEYNNNGSTTIKYTRWESPNVEINPNTLGFPDPTMVPYVFRQDPGGKVSFAKEIGETYTDIFFEIVGYTIWREFECLENGATIQFSRNPHHHVVMDRFIIEGAPGAANYITLTRLTEQQSTDTAPYPNTVPYEYRSTMGAPGGVGSITSLMLPANPRPGDLKTTGAVEMSKYWNINLIFDGVDPIGRFDYVNLYFSHSFNQRIIIPLDKDTIEFDPYYATGQSSYFNYDWVWFRVPRTILYSFTEDYSGDGRLDRIRVQANFKLNGDFTDFDVSVEGYEVLRTRPSPESRFDYFHNGFQMVHRFTGTGDFDEDSFYIYLVPKPEIDGGNTPRWNVIRNTTLADRQHPSILVGDPAVDRNIVPFDTIPPRISYTLTLPGHPQVYVRTSEPVVTGGFQYGSSPVTETRVETTNAYTYTWRFFPIDGSNHPPYTQTVISATLGYILNLPPAATLNVSTLSGLINMSNTSQIDGYFLIENMVDQGLRALDWKDLDNQYYTAPKYPLNWGYTKYAIVRGNSHLGISSDESNAETAGVPVLLSQVFLPPNRLLTPAMVAQLEDGDGEYITPQSFTEDYVIRRVTDVLVSVPPTSIDQDNYFAWPIWARYVSPLNTDPFADNDEWDWDWRDYITDTGILRDFDGSRFLEYEYLSQQRGIIQMQSRLNSSLSGSNFEIFWTTNVSAAFRNPAQPAERGRGTGGLWIPNILSLNGYRPRFYYAPIYNATPSAINQSPLTNVGTSLYNYDFPGAITSGNKIEFIYRLTPSSDLFVARLHIARGAAIPPNWYQLVRPFSFDIQDVRRQRGGVTMMNNVINSGNREVAYIRYHMARAGRVTINIHTMEGALVKSIRRNEMREAGEYTDGWDGTNNAGRPVARGMYFMRIVAPDIDEIRQIMVIR